MPPTRVTVVNHPLVKHHLAIIREKMTPPKEFRESLAQLTTLVSVPATGDLMLQNTSIETPLTNLSCETLSQSIGLVPILRAGIGMVEPFLRLIPTAEVWHLGLYRDESTAQPIHYYSKLPSDRPVDLAFILDPMLATGGSACMACESMQQWGVGKTVLVSIIAAPEGVQKVNTEFPDTQIYSCALDECLNDNKFIVPGLGDAGDRVFNTV